MSEELSPQQAAKLKELVEQAEKDIQKKAEEFKDKPNNIDAKRELARKIAAAAEIGANFKLGVLPSPERATELIDDLESNINGFIRLLKKVIEAIKTIIQGIVDILKTLVDGIKSLFPKQETETAYLGDNALGTGNITTFAMLTDPIPPDGVVVIPPTFANTPEPIRWRFRPANVAFSVRSTPAERFQCFKVESLVSRSAAADLGGIKLPEFNQMLDPRKPSGGAVDLETGLVTGELATTLFDGTFYRAHAPIFVRSNITGRYSPDTGLLQLSTEAIDVASNEPFMRMIGKSC